MRYTSRIICVLLLPVSLVLFCMGLFTQSVNTLQISIILLWLYTVSYALSEMKERIFFLAFLVAFFTFILGRTVAEIIYPFINVHQFDLDIQLHTNICVYIALISFWGIFALSSKYHFTFGIKHMGAETALPDKTSRYDSSGYQSVRFAAKMLYYVSYPFEIIVSVEKAIFVSAVGYSEYYVSYSSEFPYFFTKLADVSQVALFIFLATMPNKKEVKLPVVFYILSSVLSLFGGKRSELIVPLLILLLYFSVRNHINPGHSAWITKKHIILIAIVTPFLLAGMYLFNYLRFGQSVSASSLSEMIAGFFDNLGFSVNIISYEKLYEAFIPNKLYSFGNTIDYLRENVLTQLFFDFPVYKAQTIEKALNGNNFAQLITYLYSKKYYLSGRGLGSCYIAEAYHDFGYIGIVLWSGLYAIVIKKLYHFKNKGIVFNTMSFCALKYILLAPRTMASAFISEFINVNTWLVIIVVFAAANVLRSQFAARARRKVLSESKHNYTSYFS